jgi:hypothetical protein
MLAETLAGPKKALGGRAMELTVSAEEDKAVLSFSCVGDSDKCLTLNQDQLREMIIALGSMRSRLVMGQPRQILGLDVVVETPVFGPSWVVRLEAMTEGSMFAFAHPAYGTVGFVLPPQDVEKMIRVLTNHLGMVRSEEVGRVPN